MSYSFAAHLARFGPGASYRPMTLSQAQSYCARLTRSHYENFSVASIFLPRRLVPHFHPVYSWCRWADDLGDETGGGQRALDLLAWWREELLNCYADKTRHPVLIALRPTIERFGIPPELFLDLISAFEQDQRVTDYSKFDELLHYCQRSANPVGRLVLYLCDSFDEERAALSDRICTGLQLANFWQDVKRDRTELSRVYLPEEDRRRFGYGDEDLRALRFTPAFRDLMHFQVSRTRQMFEEGWPLLALLPHAVRADIELFLEGGLAILRKIEQNGYDVLIARPRLSKWEKGRLVLRALLPLVPKLCSGTHCSRSSASRAVQRPTCYAESRASKQSFEAVRSQAELENEEPRPRIAANQATASYAWCHHLTKRTARNFYYAFLVLPREQRKAMDALYAFMRVTDDLADEAGEVNGKRMALQDWRQALDRALRGEFSHPLHLALRDIVQRHGIPPANLHAVIDGVESDLQPVRFDTFDDLYAYCYRVASAVGLCCIHIWGFEDERAKEYAEAAGIAFQLTNILRDLGEDLDGGRVYLPREDLERFDCPPEKWRDRPETFQRMMRFQIERARSYYRKAEHLSAMLSPSGRAVFQVMMRIYRGLLEEIDARHYDVFSNRVRVSPWRKLRWLLLAFPVRWGWL